jgi:hypothetical protein
VSAPVRIQLRRTKAWRMPENAVAVTRGPGRKWGNPFLVGDGLTAREAIDRFRAYAINKSSFERDWLEPLRGKSLACWCQLDQPCHADVLLELANPPATLKLAPLPERKLNISRGFDAALARAPRSGWNRRR